jgi:hypothetical protein
MKKFVYLLIIFSIIFLILLIISSTTSFFVFNLANNNVPNFIFPLVIIGLSVYISGKAYNAYQRKMDLEEATRKLRKIREKDRRELVILDEYQERVGTSGRIVKTAGGYPSLLPYIEVYYPVPPSLIIPLSEYESKGVKLVKKVAPDEWKRAQYLLREIIIHPYYAPPNSQNEKERKEFERIKHEWEKIKESILEKSKEISSQREPIEKLEGILFTIADNFSYVFPFAAITHPDVLSPEEAMKNIYNALRELEDILNKHPFLKVDCELIKTVTEKLIKIYNSGSFKNKEIFYEIHDKMFLLQRIRIYLKDLLSSLDPAKINSVLDKISYFINSPPEIRIELIARGIITEAHETAHGVFERIVYKDFGIPIRRIYEDELLHAINEGFAMAYSLYHLLSEIEKGSVSPRGIVPLTRDVEMLFIKKNDPNYLSYYLGAKLFGLKEICEKIENINFSNLSPEEFRKVVGDLKKEVREKIERVLETLKENREIVVNEKSWEERYEELIKKLYQS